MLESGYTRLRVAKPSTAPLARRRLGLAPLKYNQPCVCKCIHFTARVRITYAVMNQEMRADHSHERREHDQRKALNRQNTWWQAVCACVIMHSQKMAWKWQAALRCNNLFGFLGGGLPSLHVLCISCNLFRLFFSGREEYMDDCVDDITWRGSLR